MRHLAWLAALAASVTATTAAASDLELLAGAEGGGDRGYAFAQPMLSFHLRGSWDLVLRGGLSYYAYDLAAPGTHVSSPGLEAGVTFRFRGARTVAGIGAGFEARDTRRDHSALEDEHLRERGATLQAFVLSSPTPMTHVDLVATYGAVNGYGWSRLGVRRQIGNARFERPLSLSLGGELTLEGNDDARTAKAGLVVDLAWLRQGASLQLRAGIAKGSEDDGPRAYVGLGTYTGF